MTNSTTSTLYRQWVLLQSLKRGSWTGTSALQQTLQREGIEINLRTIQRDLKTLAERFPLEADGLSPQGWRWRDDAPDMSAPSMTSGQALTFMMVEQHLRLLMPASILDELRPWFDNARRQASQNAAPAHRWADKVRIVPSSQPLIPPAINNEVLEAIQDALLQEKKLDACYENRSKKETQSVELDPLALIQRGPVMYLIATRSGNKKPRIYALHRFRFAVLKEEKARKPKDFHLDSYLKQGALGFGNGGTRRLSIVLSREAGEHLYESRLSEDQKITERPDGTLQICATVADTPQLDWWLRAVGAKEMKGGCQ